MTGPASHPGLIFVGGCMRSGTTLMHKLLCAAPEANPVVAECQYLTSHMNLYAQWAKKYDLYLHEYFASPENFETFSRSLAEQFLTAARIRLNPSGPLVLKNPELTFHFLRLFNWFPYARFVVVMRDPRDTIASMLDVADRHRKSGQSSSLVSMGRDVEQFATYFKGHYASVLRARDHVAGRMLIVRYEDLVTTPDIVMQKVAEMCGLAVPESATSDESLQQQSLGGRKASKTDGYASAFWSPLYNEGIRDSQVGRFRDVLSDEEVSAIEQSCQDINALFKYW